jgi:hypothetical protein
MKIWDWIKKSLICMIIIIILLVTTVLFGFKSCSSDTEKQVLISNNDSLQTSLNAQAANAAYYAAKLDTCENNIQKPLTDKDRLANAEAEIERLKSQPVAAPAPVMTVRRAPAKTKRKAVNRDVTETQFQAVAFAAPVVRVSSQMTQASDNDASNAQYKAVFKGAVGVTITPKRNPIYYVKGSDAIKAAPYWCGDSNKKMSYDTETGYWFYADLGRILSDQELSDSNFFLLWNILTGTVNWGGGSYKTWLPHESIKTLLNSVRGFEYGYITNDDLNQMSQKDSRIWSPSNPSGIYQPLKTEVRERTDANFWQGWNYHTKVNFTRIIN